MTKYSESIMSRCRQRLDLEEDDTSRDTEIERWSKERILDECLIWEGIIGFTGTILAWVKELYWLDDIEEE